MDRWVGYAFLSMLCAGGTAVVFVPVAAIQTLTWKNIETVMTPQNPTISK